jgi:hypothetical protein
MSSWAGPGSTKGCALFSSIVVVQKDQIHSRGLFTAIDQAVTLSSCSWGREDRERRTRHRLPFPMANGSSRARLPLARASRPASADSSKARSTRKLSSERAGRCFASARFIFESPSATFILL